MTLNSIMFLNRSIIYSMNKVLPDKERIINGFLPFLSDHGPKNKHKTVGIKLSIVAITVFT